MRLLAILAIYVESIEGDTPGGYSFNEERHSHLVRKKHENPKRSSWSQCMPMLLTIELLLSVSSSYSCFDGLNNDEL